MRFTLKQVASSTRACSSSARAWLRAIAAAGLVVVASATVPGELAGQEASRWAVGTWAGTLEVGSQQLQIVYEISRSQDGAFTGTMAVPAQGATDILLEDLSVIGRKLSMSFPVPGGGSFAGELAASGGQIHGTFTQGARSFPLDLERVEEDAARSARPQEPTLPLPYRTEDVRFTNPASDHVLAGTLSLPEGHGPFLGVVLVSGAGAQDRDGSMFGHRPMLVIADHLTRRGIAVLRFDDRGVGGSEGDFDTATPQDLATDVEAAVAFLANRPDVATDAVGVAGHSDGALAAAIAARNDERIAFLVMLAGSGLPGVETVADQVARQARVGGAPDAVVAMNRRLYGELARVAAEPTDGSEILPRLRAAAHSAIDEFTPEIRQRAFVGSQEQVVEQLVDAFSSPWIRFTLRHDPRETLDGIRVPVLALNGEKDLQTVAGRNLRAIAGALRDAGNEEVDVRALPGLNHLLQQAETGASSEFSRIEETVAPSVLRMMGDWIVERIPSRS